MNTSSSIASQPSEELAARYVQLVYTPRSLFAGHEQELASITDELWERHGKDCVNDFIEPAKQAYRLLGAEQHVQRH